MPVRRPLGPGPFPFREVSEGHGHDYWYLILGSLIEAVFIGLVLLLALWLAWQLFWKRSRGQRGPLGLPRTPALDALELRYAGGHLDRADYLQRRADLLASAANWAPSPSAASVAPSSPPQPPVAPAPPPPVEPPRPVAG